MLKATGMVRRIDDLGRLVVPKEIRRTLRIRDNEPLEVYISGNDEIIFKKYSPLGELSIFAEQYAEAIHKKCGYIVVVCDRDCVIAVAGVPKEELIERRVSLGLVNLMEEGKSFAYNSAETAILKPIEGVNRYALVCEPIIIEGSVDGAIMLLAENMSTCAEETEDAIIAIAADILGKK